MGIVFLLHVTSISIELEAGAHSGVASLGSVCIVRQVKSGRFVAHRAPARSPWRRPAKHANTRGIGATKDLEIIASRPLLPRSTRFSTAARSEKRKRRVAFFAILSFNWFVLGKSHHARHQRRRSPAEQLDPARPEPAQNLQGLRESGHQDGSSRAIVVVSVSWRFSCSLLSSKTLSTRLMNAALLAIYRAYDECRTN